MNNYLNWLFYELRWLKSNRYQKKYYNNILVEAKKYAGKKMLDANETNRAIYDAIIKRQPFFAGRLGGSEMKVIAYCYRNRLFPYRTDARIDYISDLCRLSGFFPSEIRYGEQFVDLMTRLVKEIDIDGVWSIYMEEWFLHKYAKTSNITWIHNLEPWNMSIQASSDVRWTYALKGKKVLVIHPFADTIRKQYVNHRCDLFKSIDENMLPEFELVTIKAVQSLGGEAKGYNDWFEAYEYMLKECKKTDFDVAIIGCGAYGFPLGAEIKKMGKVAIHLGGATQLLFGIQGKRWDAYGGIYVSMVNECWTRVSEEEITPVLERVEGGCYL